MYKLKSSKTVYWSKWMAVYEDLVIDEEQGAVGTFNRINVDDAATIVPIFEDGSLLMVENYRHAVSTNLLESPYLLRQKSMSLVGLEIVEHHSSSA